ncbi:14507_t:CDS:2, partial [Acaulospora colombiana]
FSAPHILAIRVIFEGGDLENDPLGSPLWANSEQAEDCFDFLDAMSSLLQL